MLFVDYTFSLLPDGSIMMDEELKPSSLQVETGDRFVVFVVNDKIYFRKMPEHGSSSTDK